MDDEKVNDVPESNGKVNPIEYVDETSNDEGLNRSEKTKVEYIPMMSDVINPDQNGVGDERVVEFGGSSSDRRKTDNRVVNDVGRILNSDCRDFLLNNRIRDPAWLRSSEHRLIKMHGVATIVGRKANFKRYNTAPYQINKIMKMNINNSKSEANNSKGESNGSLSSPLTASPVSNRSSLSPSSSLSLLVISNLSPNGESFSATNLGPSALKSLSLKKSKLSSKVGSNLSSKNNTGISFIPRLLSSSKLSPFVEKNKENVPLFGGGATIRELMLPIYENADAYDVIKIGVLCINDRLYENYPYNLILKKCQQNLDNLVPSSEISERISKRINEISDISDIKEAERVIKSWHNNDELFSDDFDASILNFIRNLFEKM
ncbi:hypothetical protein F8M41_007574 [Gigaspora margarita]|uniref:Uncharacterized protein n=1 Tax=Gigaspora margarita TaxID=4874 RepID=A0A8H3X5I8_GIGMA|nr:hypothetical protein F8M41_007574 [Gigaspora margarita]